MSSTSLDITLDVGVIQDANRAILTYSKVKIRLVILKPFVAYDVNF